MAFRSTLISFLFVFLLTPGVVAQNDLPDQRKDFELWTSAGLQKEFLKNFELEVEAGYRLKENVTRTKVILGEAGITYKVRKWIRITLNYRLSSNTDVLEHRLNGDLLLRAEIDRFRISLRNRLQREWELNKIPTDKLRERLKLEYNIRKFPVDPYLCAEAWYRFNTGENQYEEFWIDLGLQWKITNKSEMEVFYRISREVNINDPLHAYILGLEFNYSFD